MTLTCDPGSERAPRDVILIVPDDNIVISGQSRQVADAARSILVVHTLDLGFGWTLNGQVKTPFNKLQTQNSAFSTQKFLFFSSYHLLLRPPQVRRWRTESQVGLS